jgi:HEAT repeat protein
MKIMKELLGEDEYVEELLRWLSRWDTEYAKFIDPKIQLLTALEEHHHPRLREEVERFLEDVNEPARFHAASTLLAHGDATALPALVKLLLDEESVRVRMKVAEGLSARGWRVPDADRTATRKVLPPPFGVDSDGKVAKR